MPRVQEGERVSERVEWWGGCEESTRAREVRATPDRFVRRGPGREGSCVAPTASREPKCASPQVLRRWASLPLSLSLFVSPALTEEVFALQCAWDTARLLAREP